MDPAAASGEQATAAALFFRSLRKTYRDGYALLTDLEEVSNTAGVTPTTPAPAHRYGSVTMPFGKHKAGGSPRSTRLICFGSSTTSRPWTAR